MKFQTEQSPFPSPHAMLILEVNLPSKQHKMGNEIKFSINFEFLPRLWIANTKKQYGGTNKNVDCKKVWSEYKNRVRLASARIARDSHATAHGFGASHLASSDLEKKKTNCFGW